MSPRKAPSREFQPPDMPLNGQGFSQNDPRRAANGQYGRCVGRGMGQSPDRTVPIAPVAPATNTRMVLSFPRRLRVSRPGTPDRAGTGASGSARMSISTIFPFAMVRARARDHILRRGAGPVTTLGGT